MPILNLILDSSSETTVNLSESNFIKVPLSSIVDSNTLNKPVGYKFGGTSIGLSTASSTLLGIHTKNEGDTAIIYTRGKCVLTENLLSSYLYNNVYVTSAGNYSVSPNSKYLGIAIAGNIIILNI